MLDNEIQIVKEIQFEAAHKLPKHKGKCYNLHGHTYKLQIGIKSKINPETGMVCDFSNLKKEINDKIISLLDHSYLNDITQHNFPCETPTAENMVLWIQSVLNNDKISFIRLYETPTSYAEWHS